MHLASERTNNTVSTRYTIYDKYANALADGVHELSRGNRIHIDAARLALRLALDELDSSIPPTSSISSMPLLQAGYDALAEQLIRLNNWCANHAPAALNGPGDTADVVLAVLDSYAQQIDKQSEELRRIADESDPDNRIAALKANLKTVDADNAELRSQLAQLDADNAALIRRNKELADELKQVRLDRQETAFHTISASITDHENGTAISMQPAHAPSPISNQQSPINNSMWTDSNMLTSLDDIARDWWIGCAAGRHQWRSVPKPIQLQLVRHVLSFGPETGSMKMVDFDAVKPDWMPGSGSHTKTLSLSWQQLNDWSVEL